MTRQELPFHNLSKRHKGLTDAIGSYYTEAARVCLDRHHVSPTEFQIDNAGNLIPTIAEWQPTDERTKLAHANEIDATEAGAYACALAAVEVANGMIAVYRAETKTGSDYYVAPAESGSEDLEECVRLEISGVDKGPTSTVAHRLKVKVKQASRGSSNLPALAGVVGFGAKLIMLSLVEDR